MSASASILGRRQWRAASWAVAAVVVAGLLAPLVGNPYHVTVAVNLCVTLILTLSLNLVVGDSGQFHLSHAAFFGLGAYVPAMLVVHLGLSPWLALPCGVAAVGLLAALLAIPVTRLVGLYLAVATLAFSLFVEILVNQGGALTGGGYGLQGLPAPQIAGVPLRGRAFYVLSAIALVGVCVVLRNVRHSKFGREIAATRDNAAAAAASGIDTACIRLVVLVIAATLAALAGWLHAFYHLSLTPGLLRPELAFLWFFMVLVGGLGNMPGVILGTLLLGLAPEFLGIATGQTILGVGVLMILVTLFAPHGLGGLAAWFGGVLARRIGPADAPR
jgi:branched-chain amino acid transport system permease protein